MRVVPTVTKWRPHAAVFEARPGSQSGGELEHTRAGHGCGRCRGIDRDMRSSSPGERVDAQSSIHLCVESNRGSAGRVVLHKPEEREQGYARGFGGKFSRLA